MKITAKKSLLLAALTAVFGLSVSAPAHADWDHRGWYHPYYHAYYGHPWYPRPYWYPAYYPAPVATIVPPPVVYSAPQPYYAAPVGLNVGVHIR